MANCDIIEITSMHKEAIKMIDQQRDVDIEDVDRILKRYRRNRVAIEGYNSMIANLEALATDTTLEIEATVKTYTRAKRKQINRIEAQNRQIVSLLQRIEDPIEYKVVLMYYFGSKPRKNPRREIAEEICYDEAYTSQIKNKALLKLSHEIEPREVDQLLKNQ